MTIFILHENPKECAKLLDDKSLDKMIKDIAQVLCNVHWMKHGNSPCNARVADYHYDCGSIPLRTSLKSTWDQWSLWVSECAANYDYMVQLGLACCKEYEHRYSTNNKERIYAYQDREIIEHKLLHVIEWARDNNLKLPINDTEVSLPNGDWTLQEAPVMLPVIMPKKYISKGRCMCEYSDILWESYRDYYKAKMRTVKTIKDPSVTCAAGCCDPYMGVFEMYLRKWTKREMPEFLK